MISQPIQPSQPAAALPQVVISLQHCDHNIALRGVSFESRLRGLCQRTIVSQTFINREPIAIEAVYTFPLPSGAAVCAFEVITGDRVLTGVVDELEKSIEKYEQAVAEGHGAFMAELHRPDVFSTRVGNLKPGQAVTIRLTYVAQLAVNERVIRVAFPTTLAPRYAGTAGMDPREAAISADTLNPPHVLSVPYGLTLNVDVDLGVALKSVASPTHGVKVTTGDLTRSHVTLASGLAAMNRDIVLEVEFSKENAAGVQVETFEGDEAAYLAATFVPEFDADELGDAVPNETIFLVDCSGSMQGESIAQAKQALALCMRSMNLGDRFNICCFGSSFVTMAHEPVLYSEATLREALMYIGMIEANLGGTEIHDPLAAILSVPTALKRPRQLIVLTDGQVSNEPGVIDLVKRYRDRARIFSFGIGPASSEFLVKGMASETGGAAEFITQGERIEEKVLRQFSRMGSPLVSDVKVDWGGAAADAAGAVGTLFDGDAVAVFARVTGTLPAEVSISCVLNGKTKRWALPVVRNIGAEKVSAVACLWASKRIEALAGDDDAVVALSKKYQVLCDKTTFLAIEHRSVEERTKGMPELRRVPVALARGWGGRATMDCLMGAASRTMPTPAPCVAPMTASAVGGMAPGQAPAEPLGAKSGLFKKMGDVLKSKAASLGGPAGSNTRSVRRRAQSEAQADEYMEEAAPVNELTALLSAQSADGWFDACDLLKGDTLNGKPWAGAKLRLEIESLAGGNVKIVNTALALLALRQCFNDQKSLWKRAGDKARRWFKDEASAEVLAWVEKSTEA